MAESPGPLTTIFTPPAGCFDNIFDPKRAHCQALSTSQGGDGVGGSAACFYSLPETCYPAGAATHVHFLGNSWIPATYAFSPGVLPSGFTANLTSASSGGITTNDGIRSVVGCISGWVNSGPNTIFPDWCSTNIYGPYTVSGTETSDWFAGLLPQIAISWQPNDLRRFTPASAPVLPSSVLVEYEMSVAQSLSSASVAATASKTATRPGQTASGPRQTTSPSASSSHTGNSGLSAGAEAAIALGVIIAVLLLVIIGMLVFYRKKRRQAEFRAQHNAQNEQQPFIEYKSELPNKSSSRPTANGNAELPPDGVQELSAQQQPREMATHQ